MFLLYYNKFSNLIFINITLFKKTFSSFHFPIKKVGLDKVFALFFAGLSGFPIFNKPVKHLIFSGSDFLSNDVLILVFRKLQDKLWLFYVEDKDISAALVRCFLGRERTADQT